jgi:hypothetical protein
MCIGQDGETSENMATFIKYRVRLNGCETVFAKVDFAEFAIGRSNLDQSNPAQKITVLSARERFAQVFRRSARYYVFSSPLASFRKTRGSGRSNGQG